MSRHDQRGARMTDCPNCGGHIYSSQPTVITPVRVDGKWRGVLAHAVCDPLTIVNRHR